MRLVNRYGDEQLDWYIVYVRDFPVNELLFLTCSYESRLKQTTLITIHLFKYC